MGVAIRNTVQYVHKHWKMPNYWKSLQEMHFNLIKWILKKEGNSKSEVFIFLGFKFGCNTAKKSSLCVHLWLKNVQIDFFESRVPPNPCNAIQKTRCLQDNTAYCQWPYPNICITQYIAAALFILMSWNLILTFATVHITDDDVRFCDSPGMLICTTAAMY